MEEREFLRPRLRRPGLLTLIRTVGAAAKSEIGADNHRDSNIKHLRHQVRQDGQRPHEWLIPALAKFLFHAGADENGDINQNPETRARRGEARDGFAQNGESQGDGRNDPPAGWKEWLPHQFIESISPAQAIPPPVSELRRCKSRLSTRRGRCAKRS